MKRIFTSIVAAILALSFCLGLFACGTVDGACEHSDRNTDGVCDKCMDIIGECTHADANTDGKCDKCEGIVGQCVHMDSNTDGKCDKCGGITGTCKHVDNNENGACDKCYKVIGKCEHTDSNNDGRCGKCGAIVGACIHVDMNVDGMCDKCEGVVGICEHSDGNTDGKCDFCEKVIGECTHADANTDGKCDKCEETIGECIHNLGNANGRCDKCGAVVGKCIHVDVNKDGRCDNCSAIVGACEHADRNDDGECDKCLGVVGKCIHRDANTDGKCDFCEEIVGECEHKDENTDGRCEKCEAIVGECSHIDADTNGRCDKCNAVVGECVHVDSNGNKTCDKCGVTVKCEHSDNDNDEYCDKCGDIYVAPEDIIDYPWDRDTLLFQFTDNDNNKELSSGCRRYLAGDLTGMDPSAKGDIDTKIQNRNKAATAATGISVQYLYWPNNHSDYAWSSCIKRIEEIVTSKSEKGCPDLYVTFIYDLVGASVKGYFANLKGTSRQNGNNYFKFNEIGYNEEVDNCGYMNEWMNSVTLSQDKKYVLASDYFTDMVRAFFIMPIGINILEQVGPEVNGTDEFTLHDFYDQVWAMEWTYAKLMEYSAAAYADDGVEATTRAWIGDKQIGFAFSRGAVAGSGLLFTTKVRIISQIPNDRGGYDYVYPARNDDLYDWAEAVKNLWDGEGIIQVPATESDPTYSQTEWGNSHLTVIRKRFSQGAVLFGDIMMVGALEYSEYQSMRDIGGFGVTVVPLYEYHEGDRYLTQIHNVARPGAIAYNTQKFEQCTAYLNYQSTHSTGILNEYYNMLAKSAAYECSDTIEMFQYIRANIRTSFDKTIEDAAAEFSEGGRNGPVGNAKVNVICSNNQYKLGRDGLREKYYANLVLKQDALDNLVAYFKTAAD